MERWEDESGSGRLLCGLSMLTSMPFKILQVSLQKGIKKALKVSKKFKPFKLSLEAFFARLTKCTMDKIIRQMTVAIFQWFKFTIASNLQFYAKVCSIVLFQCLPVERDYF